MVRRGIGGRKRYTPGAWCAQRREVVDLSVDTTPLRYQNGPTAASSLCTPKTHTPEGVPQPPAAAIDGFELKLGLGNELAEIFQAS
jgi:hypothetical protein